MDFGRRMVRRGSRTDLKGERNLEAFSVDAEVGVEAEGAGLGGVNLEGEGGAAAKVVTQDVSASGVELEESLRAFVKGVEVSEGLQEGFQAGDGLPGGIRDAELEHLKLAAAQEQAFVASDAELEVKASGLAAHARRGRQGDFGDMARDGQIGGGILRYAGAGGRESSSNAVGAAECRCETGGVAAWSFGRLGGEMMEILQAWASDEQLYALRVHQPEVGFENGLAIEGFEFGGEGDFFAGFGRRLRADAEANGGLFSSGMNEAIGDAAREEELLALWALVAGFAEALAVGEAVMELGLDDGWLEAAGEVVERGAEFFKGGWKCVDIFREAVLGDEIDELEGLGALSLDKGFGALFDGLACERAQGRAEQGNLRRDLERAFFLDEPIHICGGEADDVPCLLSRGGLQHARRHGDICEEGRGGEE